MAESRRLLGPRRREPSNLKVALRRAVAVLVPIGCLLAAACGSPGETPAGVVETQSSAGRAVESVQPELQRLVGSWLRPDGGYVLEVRSVAPDGSVEATYLNPRPIHVSLARADWFAGTARLFVEFDDDNYRGSTYQLDLLADRDVLHGTYFQAEMGQTFEVVFVRRP